MAEDAAIVAGGAIVARRGPEVLLVHRPKYDDWSFPKGKVDPGEHVTAAAVREVSEETGLHVRLGPPLTQQRYTVRNGSTRDKHVHYWVGRAIGTNDVSGYPLNDEIDDLAWVPLEKAEHVLSYDRDRATLAEATPYLSASHPLVVLRHGKAKSRKRWTKDDRDRPLGQIGLLQAEEVVPVLGAYGVRRVVTSSSRRCRSTVAPFADVARLDLQVTRDLSEEDATARSVAQHVHRLLQRAEPAAICTHRPVLPHVFEALGVAPVPLRPGEMLVVHHRGGDVVALEQHLP